MPASSPYLRHLPAVEGEQASEDTEDFWAVWQAASGGLPSRATRPFLHGMTGGAFRSSHAPLLQSDLSCWLVPGLALCGVQAALMPLPADASELLSFLRDAFRHTAQLPLFAFAISPEEANDADSNLLPVSVSTQQRRNRDSRTKPEILENDGLTLPPDDMEISRQTLLTALAADKNCLTLITRTGTPQTVRLEELVGFASHTLLLKRAPLRVSRAVCARWAIHQWAVFALACPERLLTTNAADAPIRELASQFWNEPWRERAFH